jgi:hypothetical protein
MLYDENRDRGEYFFNFFNAICRAGFAAAFCGLARLGFSLTLGLGFSPRALAAVTLRMAAFLCFTGLRLAVILFILAIHSSINVSPPYRLM